MNLRLFIAATLLACVGFQARAGKPNVLLIVADDLGFSDLECYGGEIDTPHLDRLAEHGTRFTQFYTTGRCCPSRASLLTGKYPHRVGLGHMTKDIGQPGYRGQLVSGTKTIADHLSKSGYRSFISGKWHLGTQDPTQHGFEEFFGTLVSAKTFWEPEHFTRLRVDHAQRTRELKEQDEFYATDAVVDHAIKFIDIANTTPERPWFLYLAFNAPHFPLQAPKSLIEKYVDQYEVGWDKTRVRRLSRMRQLGIVPKPTQLTPRSRYFDWGQRTSQQIPSWDELNEERRLDLARRMAIYAAMVESMDQNIGRLLEVLKHRNQFENTLVIFTSDNGACAEWDPFGFDGKSGPHNRLHRGKEIDRMGAPGTFHSVGSGWANVSNTPWRLFKHFNHEGGIAVPMLVRQPGTPKTPAVRICRTPSHLIDILPTILDAAGGSIDEKMSGRSLMPLLSKTLRDNDDSLTRDAFEERMLFFEHEGNRAVRAGRWKLVALRNERWELYDMQRDRTETDDVAASNPELVQSLSSAWEVWAHENNVMPLPADYGVPYVPADDPSVP
ncbi:MAG: arylsulfatase [Planctomycetota bacterium]